MACSTSSSDAGRYLVACGRSSGAVDVYSGPQGQHSGRIMPKAPTSGQDGAHAAALAFLQGPGQGEQQLLTCTGAGALQLHRDPGSREGVTAWGEVAGFQTAGNVACLAVDGAQRRVALGGHGAALQVWSLEEQQRTFLSKGGKPNAVGLVDPLHITAAAWMPGAAGQAEEVLIAGTAQHKLWLYDLRAGRRPQTEVAWGNARITSLAAERDGRRVWVANGRGGVGALDVRAGRMGHELKGASGSVRCVALAAGEEPLVASVGLDRYLRVHSTSTRKLLGKLYLKQQLTCACWLPVCVQPPAPAPGDEGAAGGLEETAKEAEESAAGRRRKRQKI